MPISPYRNVVPNSQLSTRPASILINYLHTPPPIQQKVRVNIRLGEGEVKSYFYTTRSRSFVGDYELGSSENKTKKKQATSHWLFLAQTIGSFGGDLAMAS